MGFGSKTTTTNEQVQRTLIDPDLQKKQNEIFDQAAALQAQGFQPFTGPRFEGFTPDQLASFEAARAAGVAGQPALDQAVASAGGLAGFSLPGGQISAQQIDPRTLGRPIDPGSVSAQQVQAGQFAGTDLSPFLNPFLTNVVDASLGDLERSRRGIINQNNSQAALARAFGGSRQAVNDAVTNTGFANAAATTAAQLRAAGFEQAASLANRDIDRRLTADQGNQSAGLQAAIANQAASLQAQGLDKDTALRVALANQGTDLEAQRLSQGNALTAGQLRLGATGLLGALAGQQQSQSATNADLLNRIGAQQQALRQAGKDFDFQEFLRQQDDPFLRLQFLQQILGAQNFGTTVTGNSKQVQEKKDGIGSSLLGAGLTIGGALIAPGGLLNRPPGGAPGGPVASPIGASPLSTGSVPVGLNFPGGAFAPPGGFPQFNTFG